MYLSSKFDRQILKALGAGNCSVRILAHKTAIGRTTLNYRLKKLVRYRMVSKVKVAGKAIQYRTNRKAANQFRESRIFETFSGEDVVHAYRYFFELPQGSSIYSLQGAQAVKNIITALPIEFMEEAHALQKRKKILVKGFAGESSLLTFQASDFRSIVSHTGRSVGVKLLSDDFFNGPCEILCSPKALLISNTSKKLYLVIKESGMASFFYRLLEKVYDRSDMLRVFHFNEFAKNEIEAKRKGVVK